MIEVYVLQVREHYDIHDYYIENVFQDKNLAIENMLGLHNSERYLTELIEGVDFIRYVYKENSPGCKVWNHGTAFIVKAQLI